MPGAGPHDLCFEKVPRWCGCRGSGNRTLRTGFLQQRKDPEIETSKERLIANQSTHPESACPFFSFFLYLIPFIYFHLSLLSFIYISISNSQFLFLLFSLLFLLFSSPFPFLSLSQPSAEIFFSAIINFPPSTVTNITDRSHTGERYRSRSQSLENGMRGNCQSSFREESCEFLNFVLSSQ